MNNSKDKDINLLHAKLSRYFSLFAHSTRIATLEKATGMTSCNTEIVDVNGLHLSTVRNNLKLFQKHNFIIGSLTSSKQTVYCLNYDELDKFKLLFDEYYEILNKGRHKSECKPQLKNVSEH